MQDVKYWSRHWCTISASVYKCKQIWDIDHITCLLKNIFVIPSIEAYFDFICNELCSIEMPNFTSKHRLLDATVSYLRLLHY